jgi:thiamine-phosphate pyrophosphorylase
LLINNRADVASSAGADGVHLTTSSIRASVIRKTFGDEFLIGASTHSLDEAKEAYEGGADFVVFGPVFETESKSRFGEPVGVMKLNEVITQVDRIPILALGGISQRNAEDCFRAGAHGVAAISLLSDPDRLTETTATLNQTFAKVRNE